MPAQIEVRRLSGVDIGKSLRTSDTVGDTEIIEIEHDKTGCWVLTREPGGRVWNTRLGPHDTVTITGKPS